VDSAAPAHLPLLPLAIKAVNQAPEHRGLISPINPRQFPLIPPPFLWNAVAGAPWP
jgi:hypothetical protein